MTSQPFYISYALSARDNNEFLLGLTGVWRKGPHVFTPPKPDIKLNVFYRLTFTLKNSLLLMYWDGKLFSEKQFGKLNDIRAGGSWVLGQDQDTPLGSFEENQRFSGNICGLKMWSVGLNKEEASDFFKYSLSSKPSMFDSPPSYTYELKGGASYKS